MPLGDGQLEIIKLKRKNLHDQRKSQMKFGQKSRKIADSSLSYLQWGSEKMEFVFSCMARCLGGQCAAFLPC